MKSRFKQYIVFFIGWPLSILSIYIIIITFLPKFTQIQDLLVNINYYLFIIGLFSFLIYYFLRSLVWQNILKEKGYNLPFYKSNLLWASSEFKRYIPGNIWSFVGRAILYSNEGVKKSDLTKLLLTELQFILTGAVIVSLFGFPFITHLIPQLPKLVNFSLLINLSGILIFVLFVFQSGFINRTKGKLHILLLKIFPQFSYLTNFSILLKSIFAFFFLGLGYYFTISSIAFLNATMVLSLTGFFVFSLLIGLFSFVTPAGLGIREGMVTYGLKTILPIHIAGFVSIFGRISLVCAEIVYLILSYCYSKLGNKSINRIENILLKNKYQFLLLLGIITFNLYFIPVSFLRFDNFYTGRFDLGNMDQTVWNTINGRIFQFTNPDGTETVSRLAFHADFILILISPLYKIWSHPKTLLLIQSLIVSLGAIFIYKLSLNIINKNHKLLALFIAFSYLINPSLQWSILYDFHAVTLATTFLLGAYYFMHNKRYILFIIFGLLSGITKEQVWIPVSFMGLLIALKGIQLKIDTTKPRKLLSIVKLNNINFKQVIPAIIISLITLFTFYYLISTAIPNASTSKSYFALSYFDSEADNSTQLITALFTSPFELLNKFKQEDRILYYFALLEPLGFLPLVAIYMLIFAVADLMLNIFGDRSTLYQIYYQYTAVITPFLYLAVIYGISHLLFFIKIIYNYLSLSPIYKEKKVSRDYIERIYDKMFFLLKVQSKSFVLLNILAIYVLISALNGVFKYGPLPWTKKANVAMLNNPQKNRTDINKILLTIPENASVSTTNNLGAHLSQRINLYTIPHATESADYVVLLIRSNSPPIDKDTANRLKQNRNYSLKAEISDFIMFVKKDL